MYIVLSGSSSEAVDSVDLWLKSDCTTHTAAISSFRNPRRVRCTMLDLITLVSAVGLQQVGLMDINITWQISTCLDVAESRLKFV
eukprot:symbB.v1.2.020562.t2/scaffold1741.1/size103732/3